MPLSEEDILDANDAGFITDEQAAFAFESMEAGKSLVFKGDPTDGDIRFVDRRRPAQFKSMSELPEPSGFFGALASGAETGFKEIGAGALQLAGEAGELLGVEGAEQFGKDISRVVETQADISEAETADFPITGEVARVGGQMAAFPFPAARIPGAILTGSVAGALQPTESSQERGINTLIGGAAGGIFQAALPPAIRLIERGANKAGAIARSVFQAVTKKAPPANAFDADGAPTAEFVQALRDAGIPPDDLDAALDLVNSGNVADVLGGSFERAAAEGLDPAASARLAEFEALGAPGTTGQVTRQFEAAQGEDIAKGALGATGQEARQFFQDQQQRLVGAANKFRQSIGAAEGASRQERGAAIKSAMNAAKEEDRQAVDALYQTARELVGDQTPIQGADLEDVFLASIDELPVDEAVVGPIERALARFGVIEGTVTPKGKSSVLTRPDGSTVTFLGKPEQLTLANAEKLRKTLNKSFRADNSGIVTAMKNQLDTLVDDALTKASEGAPAAQKAVEAARGGFEEFKRTFDAADIVGKLTGVSKADRVTPLIDASVVIDKILKSQNKVENIQRIKRALGRSGKKNQPQAKMAVKELQRGFVDDIFQKAITETPDGTVISGAKLNSAMDKLGIDAMKELFPPDLVAEFGRLRRVIGNATIPVPRTTNPSGTGGRLLNSIIKISSAVEGVPGVGPVGRFGLSALRRSIERTAAETEEAAALAGIRQARTAATVTPKQVRDETALARFLSLYAPAAARQATIVEAPEAVR